VFTFSTSLRRFRTDRAQTSLVVGTPLDESRIIQVERVARFVPSSFGRWLHEVEMRVGTGCGRLRRRLK
jgi:hypothetical protein